MRYIGCSNWHAWKIAKALGISEARNLARFDTLQAYYSVAGRDLECELVPMMESVSLAWLLAKPVVTSIIIGAKRIDQLQDYLAAVELTFYSRRAEAVG